MPFLLFFCLMLELLIFCDRTGFAVENERSEKDILLTCGTEKGKHKYKNNRTAGTWRKHLDSWSYTTLWIERCNYNCKSIVVWIKLLCKVIIWNSETNFISYRYPGHRQILFCCCWYKRIIWVREQEPSVCTSAWTAVQGWNDCHR